MAPINHRMGGGSPKKIRSAAAPVTNGQAKFENGHHGIVAHAASTGQPYVMWTEGEYEIAFIASSTEGDLITIAESNSALARVAKGAAAAPASGARAFARVTAVPGSSNTGTYDKFPLSGKMWIKLLPQSNPTA